MDRRTFLGARGGGFPAALLEAGVRVAGKVCRTGDSQGVRHRINPKVNVRQVRHAVVAVVLLLAVPVGVSAEQGVSRIAYLSPDSGPSLYSEAFKQGLR